MYPLGHMVSEMSSTVILGRGCALLWAVQNSRGRVAAHVTREEALSSMLEREASARGSPWLKFQGEEIAAPLPVFS